MAASLQLNASSRTSLLQDVSVPHAFLGSCGHCMLPWCLEEVQKSEGCLCPHVAAMTQSSSSKLIENHH